MAILNLTQHAATPEQREAGVIDLPTAEREAVIELLTFDDVPTAQELGNRAHDIALIAAGCAAGEDRADDDGTLPDGDRGGFALHALIGGAPFFMHSLEDALYQQGIHPVYAFSRRESQEQVQADGSVRKINVFRHAGFVPAARPEREEGE